MSLLKGFPLETIAGCKMVPFTPWLRQSVIEVWQRCDHTAAVNCGCGQWLPGPPTGAVFSATPRWYDHAAYFLPSLSNIKHVMTWRRGLQECTICLVATRNTCTSLKQHLFYSSKLFLSNSRTYVLWSDNYALHCKLAYIPVLLTDHYGMYEILWCNTYKHWSIGPLLLIDRTCMIVQVAGYLAIGGNRDKYY